MIFGLRIIYTAVYFFFTVQIIQGLGKVKLPEIRKRTLLPILDKSIPLSSDFSKPRTKEEFISEYIANYKGIYTIQCFLAYPVPC